MAEIPAQDLISWVKEQLGKPYVYGADGPGSYDCSGLIKTAFKQYGVSLPHHAADQASFGQAVGKNSIKPGDLVFANWGHGRNSHVGLAVDANTIIDAPTTGKNVMYHKLTAGYRAHITAVRRLPQVVQEGDQTSATSTRTTGAGQGTGARPTRAGQLTPNGTASVGTGAATPSATRTQPGLVDQAKALVGAAGVAGGVAVDAATDPFGALADSVKMGLAPLASITAIAEKLTSAFFPTMLVRVMCGITGMVCIVIGIVLIAREGSSG